MKKMTVLLLLLALAPISVGCSGSNEAQKPATMGPKPSGLSETEKSATGASKKKDDGMTGVNAVKPVD